MFAWPPQRSDPFCPAGKCARRPVDSLAGQTHPVMQILLINLMVDMDEKRARGSMRKLLDDAVTPLEVKDKALKGLGQLL